MPTVNDLRIDGAPVAALYIDGAPAPRAYLDGALVWSTVDTPHLTSFRATPPFGRSSAPTAGSTIQFDWTVDGDVATTTLEWRDAAALNTDPWTALPIQGPGNNASAPWRTTDTIYRLTVTNSLGESDSRQLQWDRTIAPRFIRPLTVTASHVFTGFSDALRLTATWQVTSDPFPPRLTWGGNPVHITDPGRATLPDGSGQAIWTQILTPDGETYDLTLTAENTESGETAVSTATVRIPPLGGG